MDHYEGRAVWQLPDHYADDYLKINVHNLNKCLFTDYHELKRVAGDSGYFTFEESAFKDYIPF